MSRRLSLLVIAAAALRPGAALADPADDRERALRLVAAGAAVLLYAASDTVLEDALAPDECRWCGTNAFDEAVRDALRWRDTELAHGASSLVAYAATPLAGAGLLLLASADVAPGRRERFTDDLIPVLESAAYSQLVLQIVKVSTGRQRPFVRFAERPLPPAPDHNLSFFSGHTLFAFSVATSAGLVASRRGYAVAPAVWVTGLGFAAATAYLRVAADRHYATDALAGAAVGIAAGLAIPWLTGSLPPSVSLAPSPLGTGVSFAVQL